MLVISIGTSLNARPTGLQSRWYDESTSPFNSGEYSHKKNIQYLISNNDEYLFLNMVIPLPDEQKKILLFGLTVYVDLAGGEPKGPGHYVSLSPDRCKIQAGKTDHQRFVKAQANDDGKGPLKNAAFWGQALGVATKFRIKNIRLAERE